MPVRAQDQPLNTSVEVKVVIDSLDVEPGKTFTYTVNIKNNGDGAVSDYELRVPYYQKLKNASVSKVEPGFNKILKEGDHPAGFNNRSWLVNNFEPGESRQYKIVYTVDSDLTDDDVLAYNFTYPLTWTDPAGLESNIPKTISEIRIDAYIDSRYQTSFQEGVPGIKQPESPLKDVQLNQDTYYFSGSKTTKFTDIKPSQLSAFPNLVIETEQVSVTWTEPVDLSGDKVVEQLNKLDTSMSLQWGKIQFNVQSLPFLEKTVNVVFKNAPFVNEPRIKIGGEAFNLQEKDASLDKEADILTINSVSMADIAIVPDIDLDDSVVETSESTVVLSGKVSDPETNLFYKVDNNEEKQVVGIDLETGEFEVILEDVQNVNQVKFITTYENGEQREEIVLVKYAESTVEEDAEEDAAPETIAALFNPITVALVIAALALASMIGGYIYYLYHNKQKSKRNDKDVELSSFRTALQSKSEVENKGVNKSFSLRENKASPESAHSSSPKSGESNLVNKDFGTLNLGDRTSSDTPENRH
ncbi:MAG: hypothetical protein ACOCXT_04280 [Candidatus Dojkabacteria bacterium]